ncbi:MAG: hypothetical protein ABI904_20650 [Chloroflexota bacterium]
MKSHLSKGVLAITMLVLSSVACSAVSLLGGGPLLQDDFNSGSGDWGLGTDTDSSVEYSGGGLRMQAFRDNYIVWSTPNNEEFENVHVEVTVNASGTDATTAFGIICDQQSVTDSGYYMVMTPAGEYAIAKAALAQTDVFLTNNDQWASSDAITQDAASYRVGADCGNGRLTLYVDGKQIASVTDATYVKGAVGLQIWSGDNISSVDVTFDDFVVTKLTTK